MVMSLTLVNAGVTIALENVSHVSVCFLCVHACISKFIVCESRARFEI